MDGRTPDDIELPTGHYRNVLLLDVLNVLLGIIIGQWQACVCVPEYANLIVYV